MGRLTLEERFWAKVDKSGDCWTWTAAQTSTGYGVMGIWADGKTVMKKAHRLSWEFAHGPIPEGKVIDHVCHEPLCVNPAHLRLATPKQNAEHMRRPSWGEGQEGRGVFWVARYQRYEVQVKHEGKSRYFGRYATYEEACEVARRARLELFTHNAYDREAGRVSRRDEFCVPCREAHQAPVQCAPLRCYCNHRECPAFASYVPLDGRTTRASATANPRRVNTSWDDRDSPTWIDNL